MSYIIKKDKALKLRQKGYSIKEISETLNVSKSTASLWTRGIKLSKEAVAILKDKQLSGYRKAVAYFQKRRRMEEDENLSDAKKIIDNINKNINHCKLYCALLYWCEGGKGDEEGVRFINSDPILVKTFLTLFRKSFAIDENKFRGLMHLHSYHDEEVQKNFWAKITKIPENQFHKTFFKKNGGKNLKDNYPGCLAIYYNDRAIARKIRAIYKSFSI
jgi:transcriptional regulator with XRE-family HTH domain